MARSSLVPGFRFHPTDAELVMYYLKRKVLGKKIIVDAVAEVNIYEYSPWDLRDKSALNNGDLEWFFFCPKSKKYNSGSRYNRATEIGFWKATGKDRTVTHKGRTVASIKTLVFHIGHAGKGDRTDWVMHEYRLEDEQLSNAGVIQDTYVLVKLFEKAGSGPKNGAQYGAPFNEDEWEDHDTANCSALATVGPFEATTIPGYKQKGQKGPATVDMYEPSLSTVTCSANANGTGSEEVPVDDVDMMSLEDIAFLLGVSEGFTGDNDNEVVQVGNVEENGTMAPNAEDDIYKELANLINLDEPNGGASASGFTPAAYTFDKPLDDLDFNTDSFFVD